MSALQKPGYATPEAGAAAARLGEDELRRWTALLERRAGMVVPASLRGYFANRLQARMRAAGFEQLSAYFEYLMDGVRAEPEWRALLDCLTVQETGFFRHRPSLELVASLCRVQAGPGMQRPLMAWSLGCASGEEAYTLAMVLDDCLAGLPGARYFGVLATDISEQALDVARAGVYSATALGPVPKPFREAYCQALDRDRFQVCEALRRRVCFSQLNVMAMERFPADQLDLIYCQNMLIYFSRAKRARVLEALAERLAPGGTLVLGPSDMPTWSHPEMERIRHPRTLAFRRRERAASHAKE